MENKLNPESLYHRNKLLWGEEAQQNLRSKHVIVFGLGGVGGYSVEALARSGVGTLSLVDFDRVMPSNFNRQLLATTENLNQLKTEAMKNRILSIAPDCIIYDYPVFYDSSLNENLFKNQPDFVVDAIDSIQSKLDLIEYCLNNNIKIVSSMGAGNRLDPTKLYLTDIESTNSISCPFVKKVRQHLKKRNMVKNFMVLVSEEPPLKPDHSIRDPYEQARSTPPGSSPFVPPAAGLMLASHVIKKLIYN